MNIINIINVMNNINIINIINLINIISKKILIVKENIVIVRSSQERLFWSVVCSLLKTLYKLSYSSD